MMRIARVGRIGPNPLALLNTTIMTDDGAYDMITVTAEEARELVDHYRRGDCDTCSGIESYIGHPATAEMMRDILGVDVPVSRGEFRQAEYQRALAFKLSGRPEPGRELNATEIRRIGYTLKLIVRLPL